RPDLAQPAAFLFDHSLQGDRLKPGRGPLAENTQLIDELRSLLSCLKRLRQASMRRRAGSQLSKSQLGEPEKSSKDVIEVMDKPANDGCRVLQMLLPAESVKRAIPAADAGLIRRCSRQGLGSECEGVLFSWSPRMIGGTLQPQEPANAIFR